jgi:carbonic anhydrase/acetyltransferase-like protein (isoleucine patch superfamily)
MIRSFRTILPRIDPTALVDDSAQIIGDVQMRHGSSAWMNVVTRGDVNPTSVTRGTTGRAGFQPVVRNTP